MRLKSVASYAPFPVSEQVVMGGVGVEVAGGCGGGVAGGVYSGVGVGVVGGGGATVRVRVRVLVGMIGCVDVFVG